jgi:hypothetical protein
MKVTVPALMTAVLIASPAAFAQGVSNQSPGQRMQSQTKQHEGYPGASYYAPGQQKKNPKAKPYAKGQPGASGYAPGHSTTGSGTYDTPKSR